MVLSRDMLTYVTRWIWDICFVRFARSRPVGRLCVSVPYREKACSKARIQRRELQTIRTRAAVRGSGAWQRRCWPFTIGRALQAHLLDRELATKSNVVALQMQA